MQTLSYIAWDSAYSVGYTYIDNQHKKLINIVNNFYSAVKHGKGTDIVYPILNKLVAYAEEHFRDEETAMEKAGCPESLIAEHKTIHEKLFKAIFDVAEKTTSSQTGESGALMEVGALLQTWLMNHILKEDMQYAPYVRKLKGPLRK